MTRKLFEDEIKLVESEEHEQVRHFQGWSCFVICVCTGALLLSALLILFGLHELLIDNQGQKATIRLLATRSTASLSFWPLSIGNGHYPTKVGITFSEDLGNPEDCDDVGLELCIKWTEDVTHLPHGLFQIKKLPAPEEASCHEHIITVKDTVHIEACIPLEGAQLYGGSVTGTQYWPSQNNTKLNSPYVTGLGGNEGVVEPYWITSTGKAIFVPPDVPLFVTQSKSILCLVSKIKPPYLPDETGNVTLKYNLCSMKDPVKLHLYATQHFLKLPREIPDERMIQHPTWSTWARYKKLVTTNIVNLFADEIIYNGFNNSQLEIDDNWETCYGSAQFLKQTFPDPKSMVAGLKKKGFRVTLWTHPFVNIYCPAHTIAENNSFLATSPSGGTQSVWWDGLAGVINFTNSDAVNWYKARLQNLSSSCDIDAFKFDAGEASYLPGAPKVNNLNASIRLQPNVFTTEYVKTVASISKLKLAEVRVVYRNQEEPIFLRMSDKASTWSISNGLKALVTTLLAMNMVGYSFVMPDMVGGNGYGNFPSKELFIRWLQANTFMPVIQFSFVPWDYDDETVQIAKKFTSLHYQYSGKIIELAKKKVQDGTPINPPIWWIDPSDTVAQIIDSEFLLGDDILVAPILEEGTVSRDIYLPAGTWRDELQSGITYSGRQWLRNYKVNLDQLAYFTKISSYT